MSLQSSCSSITKSIYEFPPQNWGNAWGAIAKRHYAIALQQFKPGQYPPKFQWISDKVTREKSHYWQKRLPID